MNYEPLIERDLDATRRAVRAFCAERGSEEGWKAVARFAVLAYAPAQHAKHALLCCLSAWEVRQEFGALFVDAIIECAVYAATSRQPWSEPPILDPPPVEPSQRRDAGELREAIRAGDRLRAERWLAARVADGDSDLSRDYFAVAADDFEDFGHKLIVANAAWQLADLLGEKGRYAALRVGVWEMAAYRGEPHEEQGRAVTQAQLVENMVANRGDIESAHAVFLYDAAMQAGQQQRAGDYLAQTVKSDHASLVTHPSSPPIYSYARDCGAYLKSLAVAKRWRDPRIIAAAWDNLQHGPSLEAFSFA